MTKQLATKETWSIFPKSANEAKAFLERRATLSQASDAAELILNSYPQSINPVNAECYATQVVSLLASYPPEIGWKLAEPAKGVVGKSKWLPSVAELKEAADELFRFAQIRAEWPDVDRPKTEAQEWQAPTEEERQANLAKLAGIRFKPRPTP